jgi:hypothetical protein
MWPNSLQKEVLLSIHIFHFRFVVDDDRSVFMIKDGSRAWEIKDFLVKQSRCAEVTIEGQVFEGVGKHETRKVEKSDL